MIALRGLRLKGSNDIRRDTHELPCLRKRHGRISPNRESDSQIREGLKQIVLIAPDRSACRKRSLRLAWTLDPRVFPLRRGSTRQNCVPSKRKCFRINAVAPVAQLDRASAF
jgi:hypothetical protein